ncbi:hypothetical protein C2S52_018589 [Perilla frutescens var. hirtella]|nr:hypothetical protein C2S52_018589 [Perilla frutescens var. hirtella]KAH6812270.1 hypothetical protein C2S51_026032 [Perilla frutescens var. frutescens]
MKKIARFRYFHEENIVHADHQPPPNDLQVVSCGRRRITLPLIQESHHDHGRQTLSTETILDDLVYNPTPLRWYRPPEADFNGVEDRQKKRRSKRSKNEDDEEQRPLIPIEKIEGLFQAIQLRNGSRPVFLYRKKLQDSDVKRNLNRLFVTRRERMMGFLREEEAAAVAGGGLKIEVGVDDGGNVYDKLGLTKWKSLKMTIINKNWGKVVKANNAKKGDVVEIWGFRVIDEKPCLAFNFRRENGGDNDASSSGTTCSDEGISQV